MSTAAAPSPAPKPAARPVLLVPPPPLPPLDDEDKDVTEAPNDDKPLDDVDVDVGAVGVVKGLPLSVTVPVLVAVAVSVLVPSDTSGLAVNAVVDPVRVSPSQVVLPITVTVLGCVSPSLTANLPVSQLQSGSPGQQYQSWSVSHLARGMEVFESAKGKGCVF